MSTTPQQVIIDALTILGVVFPGQTPGASILTDAFTRLNDMLASWSIERLIVYGIEKLDFNLVTNTNTYTIGPTGTFAGTRPISIVAAQIIIPSGQRFPLKLITTEEWNDITDRAASASVPSPATASAKKCSPAVSLHVVPLADAAISEWNDPA